jgi:HAT1-interacting factor 1
MSAERPTELEAGPSGAGNKALGKSVEETEELFNTGVACIKTNALEMAADIFAQVLRARIARYGELAAQCASSYYRYGSVLLYQAQDNADVFGANLDTDVHQDVEDKENTENTGTEDSNKDKRMLAIDEEVAAAVAAEEEQGGEEIEATDLEIAWENLDAARAIWEKHPEQNCEELAAVHVLLGDVALENEAFENSLIDYQQALDYQKLARYAGDDRRTAEVYFKCVMALQFLERPEDALVDVQRAQDILEQKLQNLKNDKDSQEIQDVSGILEDLQDKKTELQAQAQEKKAMSDAVRGALSKIQQQQGKEQEHQQEQEQQQGKEHGQGDVSLAPTGNKSNVTSPVKDLGVVGRGTKRIKLEPVQDAQDDCKKAQEMS